MATLLYGLAGKLLGELCSPVIQDYVGKPWIIGTKAEFEKLKGTLSSIEAVLLDAEEKQRTNNQVRDWLIKIKFVFYDLEDLLQEVTTEALKRQVMTKNKKAKKVHIFFSRSNQVKYRFKTGRKVKLIRERMDGIASDSIRFNLAQLHDEMPAQRSHRREETHSFIPVGKLIGRDADKEFVTSLLLQSVVGDNVSVISIVGIGGLGKTTLPQSIYNSEEVKYRFDHRMWVCVSDPFDVKLICENIIASATDETCERLAMEVVKKKLEKIIDGRKFLIVLDDVWNESSFEWMKLEFLLTGGARGSKILITARAELIARAARSIATHVLKGLSDEDSWVLFKQVAFKREVEQVSPTIEGIGKEVVEKCFGVPLVVKAIGSAMLSVKEREIEWLDFKKNDLPRVSQDSEGTVLPILRLSYDYLSAPLKRCFMYCALYPKDHQTEKLDLIWMWVAPGLIQLDGTPRSLEAVGERHFTDLLDRSFFKEHKRAFGQGTCYKMHDLTHDLAQSVGGDEYYNLGSGTNYIVKSTRHAWVSVNELTNICRDGEKLRTLVLTKSRDEQKVNELTSTFEQLRVLSLAGLWLTSVPQFVGGLRHLYYLDLSLNSFVSLPDSICSLYNLQTLILCGCLDLKELPAKTRDLVRLNRLDVMGCSELRHMPRGLEELTCLQILTTFVAGGKRQEGGKPKCAEVCELKSLVNLRGMLQITNLRASKCVQCERNKSYILMEHKLIKLLLLRWKWMDLYEEVEEVEELLLMESLKPHPNLERLVIECYPCRKFPSWMDRGHIGVSLPNIVYIKLYGCSGWRHLPALGLLPCLQQLHLDSMDGIEYLINSKSSLEEEPDKLLFPSLKELYLEDMDHLKRLVEPTESSRGTTNMQYLPVLEILKLEIRKCPMFLADGRKEDVKQFGSLLKELRLSHLDIETLPAWVQYLPHLQTLKLSNCQEIVSLPEWMGNLTSLQELHLEELRSLTSIPDCVQRLTSLQQLVIKDCPELTGRCMKETGIDWHKIAHIPNITVGEEYELSDSSEEPEDLSCSGEESEDHDFEEESEDSSCSGDESEDHNFEEEAKDSSCLGEESQDNGCAT